MKHRKWIMVGATSALGLGIVAGGAVLTANALTLEDTKGAQIGEQIRITSATPDATKDVPSVTASAPETTDATDATAPAPVAEPTPAAPAPAPAPAPAVSVVSPASPISVNSPDSPNSPDSVPSAD